MVATAYKMLLSIFEDKFKKTYSYRALEVVFANNELVSNNMFKLNILDSILIDTTDDFFTKSNFEI